MQIITNTATLGEYDQIDSNKNNTERDLHGRHDRRHHLSTMPTPSWTFSAPVTTSPRALRSTRTATPGRIPARTLTKTPGTGACSTALPLGSYKVEVFPGDAKVDGPTCNLADYSRPTATASTDRTQVSQGKLAPCADRAHGRSTT